MKTLRKILKIIGYALMLPVIYIVVSLVSTWITVNNHPPKSKPTQSVYLSTNGVHLDIVMPIDLIDSKLKEGLYFSQENRYFSFGWGDENFYINTPTWGDLTFKNGFRALFLNSSSLMHITRYSTKEPDWVEVKLDAQQLEKLNNYLENSFKKNDQGTKIRLNGMGYTKVDDFYRANGSYTLFNTCNTWVNSAFKESGLKASLWTPFDFGLLEKHRK